MAEIKSTLEMVLARAEKMAASAKPESTDDTVIKDGMRLAADFLNNKIENLIETLKEQPEPNQMVIRSGMAETLLRNVVLPRDEDLAEANTKALQGIIDVSQNSGDILSTCQELQQILQQYSQHKEQTIQQLNEAIKGQIAQQMMAEGQQVDVEIDPRMHPQYNEELSKVLTNLNSQYNDAMDQRKDAIRQRFSTTKS